LVYQFTWTHEEDSQFQQMVLVELIILNACVPDFLCCACGLISLSSWLLYGFNLWIDPGVIYESCS